MRECTGGYTSDDQVNLVPLTLAPNHRGAFPRGTKQHQATGNIRPTLLSPTTVFESTSVYPTPSQYWKTVEKHKLTQFYSAPTAIRFLRRLGHQHLEKHDLSTLRVLGSVGEPINPEAWHWYNEHVGKTECAIVDTFWQIETGSIVVTPFPGAIETKPGSVTVPFFGIEPAILNPTTGDELHGNNVEGVLCLKTPWPSIARTIYQDHNRYLDTYMKPYPGYFYTGDGAARDDHGYIWIKGRVDDVINVSGHHLSTAEIESSSPRCYTCWTQSDFESGEECFKRFWWAETLFF
ncbi:hypothetical protein EST38_g8346 [Candolleomyces aberdarensis]|uniref:acetate--CoA ligase n=1 Tax=Candolleomyces aberdarensis TaxID=2316362 RepID=A0A4Q2DG66_9AGAR|nr:hypothetical protein EST38_g8346 [Candolleomyces aberdarensis]